MTNKEYLTKLLSGLNISEDDIDIILLKSNLQTDGEAQVSVCDNAVYNRMSVVLKSTLQNVSESGYSISWNMEAVKVFYQSLCNELGKPNVLFNKPKLRNRSNIW
ncbi:DUF6706 family protein [Capnocytophaga canimorsus]|uniref:DUF6706 family protein n=1 Tax=Capnocytophaga TaxID=1016 RepID=UPI0037D906C9